MKLDTYNFTFIDAYGGTNSANCSPNEYHNLMELLFDKYLQEWGDCKGRAWCGTCHIQIIEGHFTTEILKDERHTLSKLDGTNQHSRLACQIPINSDLHKVTFKVISDNDYISQ